MLGTIMGFRALSAGVRPIHRRSSAAVPSVAVMEPSDIASGEAAEQIPGWDEIVAEQGPRIYRLAYRLTGNRPDAEDLTQDTLMRVLRSLDSFTPVGPGSLEAWIKRIATNVFLDQGRRKSRVRIDAMSDERAERLVSLEATPDAAYEDQTFDDDIERALSSLPPDFRAAVVLCDVEGLSYDEVAEVLGVKIGTVRSRIHRGRTMLRKSLAHREPVAGRVRYGGALGSSGVTA